MCHLLASPTEGERRSVSCSGALPNDEDVSLQPLLYTGDGLLINVAYRGTPVSPAAQEYLGAVTTLASTDGQTLGTAHSGFA